MSTAERFIQNRLQQRTENGSLRKLSETIFPIDFCSNDYLGFAVSEELKNTIECTLQQIQPCKNGSAGSRLLSGNHSFTEETEAFIASFHYAEAGLIFNSGYDANIGLISSLAERGDTIISDELIHASLIDGGRLSPATRYTFRHNDPEDLENKLKLATGTVYVIIESVYSMDGDIAPIEIINHLCKKYQANLIVDEAHALGVFGDHGRGIINELGLEKEIFARVMTFGKALGCHGAIILGSESLRQYLINFARSFIYTTAAPLHNIVTVKCAYESLIKKDQTAQISDKINTYKNAVETAGIRCKTNRGAIQTILFNNNTAAREAAAQLQNKGMDVRAILSPTVPKGKERLRICIHTFNSDKEIQLLVDELTLLHTS